MLSFFPRGVSDEILNLIESVSEEFPSYFSPPKQLTSTKVHILLPVTLLDSAERGLKLK